MEEQDLQAWNDAFAKAEGTEVENTTAESPAPEETPCVDDSHNVEAEGTEPKKAPTIDPVEKERKLRKEINNRNAQRRIAKREAKLAALAKKQQELADRPEEDLEKRMTNDRIAELEAEANEQAYEDMVSDAYDVFGEGAEAYLKDVQRYASYINNNHPEVLEFWQADKTVGPVFLRAWMRRMENPTTRDQYRRATSTQRSRICDTLYSGLYKKIKCDSSEPAATKQPEVKAQPKPTYCPMSTGGRTNSSSASDGSDWSSAFARQNALRNRR